MTGLHIRLTQSEFNQLGTRQWGLPSVIQPGPKWKFKDENGDWWQQTIVDHYGGDPVMVSFESRRIEVAG